MRYFSGRLAAIPGAGTEDGLRAFFALLTQRAGVRLRPLEGENPFNIFKSLNSTGVPLGQADLIRNFVFMQVPVEDQDEFDEASGSRSSGGSRTPRGTWTPSGSPPSSATYLMRDGRLRPARRDLRGVPAPYAATEFDPRQVAADLKRAPSGTRSSGASEADPNPEVEAALDGLAPELESSTTYSLLLNLYRRRHAGRLGDAELAEAIRLLAGFILRRLVCGENSRAYGRLFVQAMPTLGEDPAGDNLRRFLEARDFPDTPRFVEAFVRFNLYGSRYRKAVLEALERSHGHKEPVELGNAQVEHIMPQTLSDAWRADARHRGRRDPRDLAPHAREPDADGLQPRAAQQALRGEAAEYTGSNYVDDADAGRSEAWGEAEIRRRGQEMAERAARIWPGPAAPVRRSGRDPDGGEPSGSDLRRRYWTGLREHVAVRGAR